MKKTTKSLLVSATVLLALAPAATFTAEASSTAKADEISYNAQGHWDGPSLDIHYNNAIQVKTGAGSYDYSKIAPDDVTASAIMDGQQYGVTAYGDTTLYKTSNGAAIQNAADVATNPTATAGTTYYQRVYLKVAGLDTNNALLSMQVGYSTAYITFNGEPMNLVNYANGNGNFVIVRSVTVSDNPETTNNNFYNINTNGTVKVTKQSSPAALYDANGNYIRTRALAPNSGWYTDIQRVKSNGENYYRVSTNEYVSEKDVDFYPAASTTATN